MEIITKKNECTRNRKQKSKFTHSEFGEKKEQLLSKKMEQVENLNRRNNLIFKAIKIDEELSLEEQLNTVVRAKLDVDQRGNIEFTRILKANKKTGITIILAKYNNNAIIRNIIKNANKLKNTKNFIERDI